jgi:hypothetical protein
LNVTSALAGLPGRAKNSLVVASGWPSEEGNGTEANVVGLPGAIDTRPKWIVAPNACSSRGCGMNVHAVDIERRRSGGRDEVNKAKGLVGR